MLSTQSTMFGGELWPQDRLTWAEDNAKPYKSNYNAFFREAPDYSSVESLNTEELLMMF